MKSKTHIKVRGYHLDGYQHVNNARYLEFMEEARWDYLDQTGAFQYFNTANMAFVIVNINIDYKYPAVQGDTIVIDSEIQPKGNTSFTFKQIGSHSENGKLVFDATVTFVLIDKTTGKPVRPDEKSRNILLGNTKYEVE